MTTTPAPKSTPKTLLDVRSVEPKHRFEKIMNAYDELHPGETLDLLVDHDPTCMYYTLKVDYGDGTFAFDYVERGPVTWRVHVTKHVE